MGNFQGLCLAGADPPSRYTHRGSYGLLLAWVLRAVRQADGQTSLRACGWDRYRLKIPLWRRREWGGAAAELGISSFLLCLLWQAGQALSLLSLALNPQQTPHSAQQPFPATCCAQGPTGPGTKSLQLLVSCCLTVCNCSGAPLENCFQRVSFLAVVGLGWSWWIISCFSDSPNYLLQKHLQFGSTEVTLPYNPTVTLAPLLFNFNILTKMAFGGGWNQPVDSLQPSSRIESLYK